MRDEEHDGLAGWDGDDDDDDDRDKNLRHVPRTPPPPGLTPVPSYDSAVGPGGRDLWDVDAYAYGDLVLDLVEGGVMRQVEGKAGGTWEVQGRGSGHEVGDEEYREDDDDEHDGMEGDEEEDDITRMMDMFPVPSPSSSKGHTYSHFRENGYLLGADEVDERSSLVNARPSTSTNIPGSARARLHSLLELPIPIPPSSSTSSSISTFPKRTSPPPPPLNIPASGFSHLSKVDSNVQGDATARGLPTVTSTGQVDEEDVVYYDDDETPMPSPNVEAYTGRDRQLWMRNMEGGERSPSMTWIRSFS